VGRIPSDRNVHLFTFKWINIKIYKHLKATDIDYCNIDQFQLPHFNKTEFILDVKDQQGGVRRLPPPHSRSLENTINQSIDRSVDECFVFPGGQT